MLYLREYGVATTINFPLLDYDSGDAELSASFAAGDTKIKKDEGASANTGSNPAHEGEGTYSLALTAAEMTAKRIIITCQDQTATKVWQDQTIIIETINHASAQIPNVWSDLQEWLGVAPLALNNQLVNSNLTRIGSNSIAPNVLLRRLGQVPAENSVLYDDNIASATATSVTTDITGYGDGTFKHWRIEVNGGTGKGQVRKVTGYTSATGAFTVDRAWDITPDTTSDVVLHPPSENMGSAPKGIALSNFVFLMVDSTDFATPETGLTIVAEISKDGGAFSAAANAAVEIGNGFYKIDLTATEMNADVVALKFTAVGAAQRSVIIKTDP